MISIDIHALHSIVTVSNWFVIRGTKTNTENTTINVKKTQQCRGVDFQAEIIFQQNAENQQKGNFWVTGILQANYPSNIQKYINIFEEDLKKNNKNQMRKEYTLPEQSNRKIYIDEMFMKRCFNVKLFLYYYFLIRRMHYAGDNYIYSLKNETKCRIIVIRRNIIINCDTFFNFSI